MKKFIGFLLAAILCLFATPAFAQHQHEGGAKPQHQQKQKPAHQTAKPAEHQHNTNNTNVHNNTHVTNNVSIHNNVSVNDRVTYRNNYHGGRIDREYFGAHFGYGNRFYLNRVYFGGAPRFWFGGFWFGYDEALFLQYGWVNTEYVYVDDIDGIYYLVNPLHPGVHIALNVVVQ